MAETLIRLVEELTLNPDAAAVAEETPRAVHVHQLKAAEKRLDEAIEILGREDIGEYSSSELPPDLQMSAAQALVHVIRIVATVSAEAALSDGRMTDGHGGAGRSRVVSSDVIDCHPPRARSGRKLRRSCWSMLGGRCVPGTVLGGPAVQGEVQTQLSPGQSCFVCTSSDGRGGTRAVRWADRRISSRVLGPAVLVDRERSCGRGTAERLYVTSRRCVLQGPGRTAPDPRERQAPCRPTGAAGVWLRSCGVRRAARGRLTEPGIGAFV